jgi:general secretion pathway protein A
VISYLKFFGLREWPFKITPDPRFICLSAPHREALVKLIGVALLRKGFMVLTGEVGAGKTMVLHSALHLIRSSTRFRTGLLSVPTLTREELLEAILEDLEIPCPSSSKVRRLSALRDQLLETQRSGGTTVLMVDEAHLLRPELIEELRLIVGIDAHADKLLQLVLCGQPELLALLAQPDSVAMRQRIAVWERLRPLREGEIAAYLADRLKAAGYSNAAIFSRDVPASLAGLSGGVPRLVNLLCDTALGLAAQARANLVTPEFIEGAGRALNLHPAGAGFPYAARSATPQSEHLSLRFPVQELEN